MRRVGIGWAVGILVAAAVAAAAPPQAGDLIFTVSESDGRFAAGLWLVHGDGSGLMRLGRDPGNGDCCADWSPDGARIVFSSGRTGQQWRAIYAMNVDGGGVRRLTNGPPEADDVLPSWSPDGGRIAWVRSVNSTTELWLMASDGSAQRRVAVIGGAGEFDWSPNGAEIVWGDGTGGVLSLRLSSGAIRQLVPSAPTPILPQPRWSPDGTRIAFIGRGLEVIDADGGSRRVIRPREEFGAGRVTGITDPAWSPDGRSIAFTGGRPTGEWGRTGPIWRQDVFLIDVDGSDERRLTGALDAGFAMPAGQGGQPVFWPDGSRIFFRSVREPQLPGHRETAYVMNVDGSCEQRFLPNGPLVWLPNWRPGTLPGLEPLRCADLRLQAGSDRWGALRRAAVLYVTVENDGNVPANGLTVTIRAQGPATLRPRFAASCRRGRGLSCVTAPLPAGERVTFLFAVRASKPGREVARISVRSEVQDPDPIAARKTVWLTFLPCTVVGTIYDDDIVGTPRRDRICSVEGHDRVNGKAGNDYLAGGSSGDVLIGGPGRDVLLGEGGRDVILAADGEHDRVDCGTFADVAVVDRIDDVAAGCEDLTRTSSGKG